jgi:hypothetical protein
MRNIKLGFAVLGLLAAGTLVPVSSYASPAPPRLVQPSAIQQADWDDCGPRCREHRREVRARELERHRWAQHRRWEESHRHGPLSSDDYQHRY